MVGARYTTVWISNERHVADQTKTDIQRIFADLSLPAMKVGTATTDNGSNFVAGVRLLLAEQQCGSWVPCICHTLQLGIGDALAASKEVHGLVNRMQLNVC